MSPRVDSTTNISYDVNISHVKPKNRGEGKGAWGLSPQALKLAPKHDQSLPPPNMTNSNNVDAERSFSSRPMRKIRTYVRSTMLMLMFMLMYSIYPRANLVTKSYDDCAMRVVFSKLQNCVDFSDGDFRDGGSAFQHMGPETAKAREPYVTVLVRGKSRSPWVAARR